MKNQYVADINDYRKYGLLRTLSGVGNIKTGVCWMLTQDDNGPDGKFTGYLSSPEKYKHYDPLLFDKMAKCISDAARNVNSIESEDVLPNAIYYSRLLTDIKGERELYFSDMHDHFKNTDLIFFDPDNGLQIESCKEGCKRSSKFLYWRELIATFGAGKSILVYQHFTREQRDDFIKRKSSEICKQLDVSEVLSFRTSNVVFFLIPQQKCTPYFKEKIAEAITIWDANNVFNKPESVG